ncbi:hypothetical protein C0992_007995, partial [Termitomyces sp. T32_za158]
MGALLDISSLLNKTHKALNNHICMLHAKSDRTKSYASSAHPMPSCGPLVKLYASLAHNIGKKNVITTLINLTSAALHLGCLLKIMSIVVPAGHIILPTDVVLLEEIIASGNLEDALELERIRGFQLSGFHGRAATLHNSLYLALAVSPLMLLNPREYYEIGSKRTIFDLWKHIGALERPPDVITAERALWKAIFSTALGGDILQELGTALEALESVMSKGNVRWFQFSSETLPLVISRQPPKHTYRARKQVASDSDTESNSSSSTDNDSSNESYQTPVPEIGVSSSRKTPTSKYELRSRALTNNPLPSSKHKSKYHVRRSIGSLSHTKIPSRPVNNIEATRIKTPSTRTKATQKPDIDLDINTSVLVDLTLEQTDDDDDNEELDISVDAIYHTGDLAVEYPIRGTDRVYSFTPKFHMLEDLEWFYSLDEGVHKAQPN